VKRPKMLVMYCVRKTGVFFLQEEPMPKLHIRIDGNKLNSDSVFACGHRGRLPEGDKMFFESEPLARSACYLDGRPEMEACPGCFPGGRPQFGTPISQLSGRPGHPGYEEFCRIARSWGHD
jgi:hypothetical protein